MKSLTQKIVVLLVSMIVIGAAGWFGRKAYNKITGRRLLVQAQHFLASKDLPNAQLCLRRALQINPFSVAANRAVADMLEAQGSPSCLEWRKRVVQLDPSNPTNRFILAETALKLQDSKSAAEALRSLSGQSTNTAVYYKLSGALAWAEGRKDDAGRYYSEALRLEPNNLASQLNLATVHIASTNSVVADAARVSLERLSTNAACNLTALRYLTDDAIVHNSLARAIKFSKLIVQDANAAIGDKIEHLQLLRKADTNDFDVWLAALKKESTHSSVQAFALAKWMVTVDGPTNTLRWLQKLPPVVQTNQPVPLIMTDCQIALQDWRGVLGIVSTQDWAEADFYRLALEARSDRLLENQFAFNTAWNKALRESMQRLDRLTRLAQVSEAWGWKTEKEEVLRQIVNQFPKATWASAQLIDALHATGNTQELKELLSKIYSEEPSNARLKNAFANVSLLRKTELEKAHRLAKEAYDTMPSDPFIISTYSYSLLLQHKPNEALEAVSKLKPEALKNPEVAGYYGVIQAESGHRDLAKAPLERAEAANLLPEEKELVKLAKVGL